MTSKLGTTHAAAERGTMKARFLGPVLHALVLIVALCAFVPFFAGILFREYGGQWAAAATIFVFASFMLIVMTRKAKTPAAIESERTARQSESPPWSLFIYCATTGLGCIWACVFLAFSRRFAFFSVPVVGVTGLIVGFYAVFALLVARLTAANWRRALVVLLLVPGLLAGIILRLGLLR